MNVWSHKLMINDEKSHRTTSSSIPGKARPQRRAGTETVVGNSSPSSFLGRNFSPEQITELPGMGGEPRNIFLTLHWKDSAVQLCCIPAGN